MSAYGKFFVGLGLATTLGYSGLGAAVAHAGGAASSTPAKAFAAVKASDYATVKAKWMNKMADYVEGNKGQRAGLHADTPEMRIFPMAGSLIKTKLAATEINENNIGGPGAEFNFHGPATKTKFKIYIPVSGHTGEHIKFAAGNEYFVTVQDASGKEIQRSTVKSVGFGKAQSEITRADLVTEHEVVLPFDAGKEFMVSFWPTETSKGGYTSGREVVVRNVGE